VSNIVLKRIVWVASSFKDFCALPREVMREMGFALFVAQCGEKHPHAKPLRGFSGAKVLEIVEDHATDTYRCVYTVQVADAVYVLHAFQKKSKRGATTPQSEMAVVRSRLKWALAHAQSEAE
jgi:phage-related protein